MKNIYVLTGMFGVGKTSINKQIVKIYTTHPVQEKLKGDKIYISEEDYSNLLNKIIEFIYAKYNYTITK